MNANFVKISLSLFLTFIYYICGFSQNPSEIEVSSIRNELIRMGYHDDDFSAMELLHLSQDDLENTYLYFQQYYDDIPVRDAILTLVIKENKIINASSTFVQGLSKREFNKIYQVSPQHALLQAFKHIDLPLDSNPGLKNARSNPKGKNSIFVFHAGKVAKKDITAELVFTQKSESMLLTWEITIESADKNDELLHINVNATNGKVESMYNDIIRCAFESPVIVRKAKPIYGNGANQRSSSDSSYRVFNIPVQSPIHGERSLVGHPDISGDPATSVGWHSDGVNHYSSTRGNNVHAYEDVDGDGLPGYSPSSSSLAFDYAYDFFQTPAYNQDAAITNLFVASNLAHNIFYQYGFDESSGNLQQNNFGRGGLGGDYLRAEAQDGLTINNAFYTVTDEGNPPRMQMFLWSDVQFTDIMVNSGSSLPDTMPGIESSLSINNLLINLGPITGDLKLVNNQNSNTHEGCSSSIILNSSEMSGKIALLDKGDCSFTEQILNVQNIGVVAAIVISDRPEEGSYPMTGYNNNITIPAVMVSKEYGDTLKASLQQENVNLTLKFDKSYSPDGSFDNGIIFHEYGHGVSTRLTGGPYTHCLRNDEQMGEGWSDYFAIMLTTDWATASSHDRRGVGTYALGHEPHGKGTRTFPYSYDMNINPLTYADIASNTSSHYIGSIWCSMLWDMTWNIIDIAGYSPDWQNGTGGNNIALQLVMDGLKIQRCNPGFIDGRDAILLADEIRYNGLYKCAIWSAFARRGLGFSARQGNPDDNKDGTEAFDLPSGIDLIIDHSVEATYEGEAVTTKITARCNCLPEENVSVKFSDNPEIPIEELLQGDYNAGYTNSDTSHLQPLEKVELEFITRSSLCTYSDERVVFNDPVINSSQFVTDDLYHSPDRRWKLSSSAYNSAAYSWYAEDHSSYTDLVLVTKNPIYIDGPALLSFKHKFHTETNFDGGVIEVSTNNGTSWSDINNHFLENPYNGVISHLTSSRLTGRSVFTGNSDEAFGTQNFISSVVNLKPYEGRSILIRFRLVCDNSIAGSGVNGWHVDDIKITKYDGIDFSAEGYIGDSLAIMETINLKVSPLTVEKIYIDPSNQNRKIGNSWTHAYHHILPALNLAMCKNVDSIFVAQGIYFPGVNREDIISLPDNIVLTGSFPPGGGLTSSRNVQQFSSIISGDIGVSGSGIDNSFHLFELLPNTQATIDGFILKSSYANGPGTHSSGSAIINYGSLTLKDLIIHSQNGKTGSSVIDNYGNITAQNTSLYSPSWMNGIMNHPSALFEIKGNFYIYSQ